MDGYEPQGGVAFRRKGIHYSTAVGTATAIWLKDQWFRPHRFLEGIPEVNVITGVLLLLSPGIWGMPGI